MRSNEIDWPLFALFRQGHAINLAGSNLIKLCDPISILGRPTLAEHGDRRALGLIQRQGFACSVADSGKPPLLCTPGPSHLRQPAGTTLFEAINPVGAGVDLGEGRNTYGPPSVTACSA